MGDQIKHVKTRAVLNEDGEECFTPDTQERRDIVDKLGLDHRVIVERTYVDPPNMNRNVWGEGEYKGKVAN